MHSPATSLCTLFQCQAGSYWYDDKVCQLHIQYVNLHLMSVESFEYSEVMFQKYIQDNLAYVTWHILQLDIQQPLEEGYTVVIKTW